MMENTSFITDLIYTSFRLISYFIDFLIVCVELRFCIGWFLNINPYFEPFLSLWAFTSPVLWFGKGFYPRIFGLQLAPIINFRLLNYIQKNLDSICETIKQTKIEKAYFYDDNTESLLLFDAKNILPILLDFNFDQIIT